MTRRSWFAAIAGAFAAAVAPKPLYSVRTYDYVIAGGSRFRTGQRIRMVRTYNVANGFFITRFDVLAGWPAPPEMSARILG